jgi:hypothetical protein
VFNQDAGVFDYEEAGGAGFRGGVWVFDSLLHPDYFCADGDGAVHNRRNVFRAAKDVDNFDVRGFRDVFKTRIGFFAEYFGFVGIDGDDAIAGGLHVLGDAKTWASGIGREADYCDGFVVFEDVGDGVIATRPVLRDGCFHGMPFTARDRVIEALSEDSAGMASEDSFLYRNLRDGQGRRADVSLDLRFSSRRFGGRDFDSIYSGDRDWTGDQGQRAGRN